MPAKIKTELCHDHFEKMAMGNACATCPSMVENEAVVRAASSVIAADTDDLKRAVATELKLLRVDVTRNTKELQHLGARVIGDGGAEKGMLERMTVQETKMMALESNKTSLIAQAAVAIAIIGVIVNVVLSIPK